MIGSKLIEAGYDALLRIRPRDKRPNDKGWRQARVDAETADAWVGKGGGLGLKAAGYPGVDIDLYDEKLSDEVMRTVWDVLGRAPVRSSARAASKLLVYRTDLPFRKKVLTLPDNQGKIEILGLGQQYVIHGMHPEGVEYGWRNDTPLWDIPTSYLRMVDEQDIVDLLDSLQQEFGGLITIGADRSPRAEVDQSDLAAPDLAHVEAFLDRCPNSDEFLREVWPALEGRDAWIRMAHAVFGAGGPQAESAFVEWSSKYEDGVNDPEYAAEKFQSCGDTITGWPTIENILLHNTHFRTDATEDFEPDLGEAPAELDRLDYTEEKVAARLLPDLGQEALQVAGAWYFWSGGRWLLDETRRAELALRKLLLPIATEYAERAAAIPAKSKALKTKVRGFAEKLQNARGIASISGLTEAPLTRPMLDFDTDLMSLNTPTGMVDLRTGVSRPTTPDDLVMRCTSVTPAAKYDPKAAPNWEAFLDHLTEGDVELADFLQRWMGYCLTGRMDEKKFVFAWGSNTNTGKSTFVNAVTYAMGDYGRGTDVDAFMGKRQNTDSLAQLPGVRMASATEASAGQKWDDKIIKAITGRDQIEVRRLHHSFFTYKPQFKLLIAGNHRPSLGSVDHALLERILIVPMNNRVEVMDGALGDKLEAEGPQILRWMIEGCTTWLNEGLQPPAAVQAATQAYAEEEDDMAEWIMDSCVVGAEQWDTSQRLYDHWRTWNRGRGEGQGSGSLIGFSRALAAYSDVEGLDLDVGLRKKVNGKRARGVQGLALRPRIALGTEDFDNE